MYLIFDRKKNNFAISQIIYYKIKLTYCFAPFKIQIFNNILRMHIIIKWIIIIIIIIKENEFNMCMLNFVRKCTLYVWIKHKQKYKKCVFCQTLLLYYNTKNNVFIIYYMDIVNINIICCYPIYSFIQIWIYILD